MNQFTFIKEIEAYAERTGSASHGTIKDLKLKDNLAKGHRYTTTFNAGKWYSGNTTDNDYRRK